VFVINSHNFDTGPAPFDPSVNGKSPIAAWVPSRDDAGNGTTTLNDLVGTANGTLTNMDPATDWVADTDAGGVRALDFDASNDVVLITDTRQWHQADFSFACWALWSGPGVGSYGTVFSRDNGGLNWCFLSRDAFSFGGRLSINFFNGSSNPGVRSTTVLSLNTWYHVGFSVSGNTCSIYVNGVAEASASIATWTRPAINNLQLGRWNVGGGRTMAGRIDDARLFDQALDATDIAALYAAQRGGQA
jgi:hypothetical protein